VSLPPIHPGAAAGREPDQLDVDEPLRLTAVVHGAVQGPRRAVRDLLRGLHGREVPGAVMKVDSHYGPATGEFRAFVTG
jgi:acylphosphatase